VTAPNLPELRQLLAEDHQTVPGGFPGAENIVIGHLTWNVLSDYTIQVLDLLDHAFDYLAEDGSGPEWSALLARYRAMCGEP